MTTESVIQIEKCPICSNSHSHTLIFKKTTVFSLAKVTSSDDSREIYLYCPTKNEPFKAKLKFGNLDDSTKVIEKR